MNRQMATDTVGSTWLIFVYRQMAIDTVGSGGYLCLYRWL